MNRTRKIQLASFVVGMAIFLILGRAAFAQSIPPHPVAPYLDATYEKITSLTVPEGTNIKLVTTNNESPHSENWQRVINVATGEELWLFAIEEDAYQVSYLNLPDSWSGSMIEVFVHYGPTWDTSLEAMDFAFEVPTSTPTATSTPISTATTEFSFYLPWTEGRPIFVPTATPTNTPVPTNRPRQPRNPSPTATTPPTSTTQPTQPRATEPAPTEPPRTSAFDLPVGATATPTVEVSAP